MRRQILLLLAVILNVITFTNASCELIGLGSCECRYPKQKRYEIDCQHSGFSALPKHVNYTLPEGDALGNFSYNNIASIPDSYFATMKHFDILDFKSNRISSFGRNTLAGLETRLSSLNLSQNKISSIPSQAIKEFIRLKVLDLSRNRITSPCRIHTADVITYSLAYNGITSLGDSCFSDAVQVQVLDLSGNKITSIGSKAFEGMNALKSLDLGFNELSDLQDGLNSLKSIASFESLSLKGNRLEFLASICKHKLPNIRNFDFGYNKLVDIQQYCFRAYSEGIPPSELTMNFEHNQINSLAGSVFAGLSDRLTRLFLNHNQIADVSVTTFRDLSKLSYLNMDNNLLDSLEFLRNWDTNSLQELSIANNMIEELSPGVFTSMMKLTKLTLDGNRMLSIDNSAFSGMVVLSDLSLRYNLLTNLADGAFFGLGQLRKLRISGNSLVTMKNCTFANLDRLAEFHFDDNLLHCDCDMLWLLEFSRAIPNSADIMQTVLEDNCYYPEAVRGDYMANVVSMKCKQYPTNACFKLDVKFYEPVGEEMNVTWSSDSASAGSPVKTVTLSQKDVENDEVVYNMTVTSSRLPVTLPEVKADKVYKICVEIILNNGNQEIDCNIWPRMIKKPTTTMAPTTVVMTTEGGLSAGDSAAIALAVILIILIIAIVIFGIYLWKTEKYRHVMPQKYRPASQEDSEPGSADRGMTSKPDPLDFRPAHPNEDDPMMIRSYQEHDL